MSRFAALLALGAVAGLSTGVQLAQAAPNKVASDLGHGLAERLCAGCHMVEPGQLSPPNYVGPPPFQAIANRANVTSDSLREHLRTTHASKIIPLTMPNPDLGDDETTKIVSYILSLRKDPR